MQANKKQENKSEDKPRTRPPKKSVVSDSSSTSSAEARSAKALAFSYRAPFEGVHATRINEKYVFGLEAQAILRKKFAYLANVGDDKQFNLSLKSPHAHAYAAFSRKHFDNIIVRGLGARSMFIDVGAHMIRNTYSERTLPDGTTQKWSEFIHSDCPEYDNHDKLRRAGWNDKLTNDGKPYPVPNSCDYLVTSEGLCNCKNAAGVLLKAISSYKSIDSAYYGPVMEGIESSQQEFGRTAYYTFHDYASAIRNKKLHYHTVDNESEVTLYKEGGSWKVKTQVEGNPFPYSHNVINTGLKSTWYRKVTKHNKVGVIVYDVQNRLPQGEHDYLLVVAHYLDGVTEMPGMECVTDYFLLEEEKSIVDKVCEWTTSAIPTWAEVKESTPAPMLNLMYTLWTYASNVGEDATLEVSTENRILYVMHSRRQNDGTFKTDHLYVEPDEFNLAYKELIGRPDAATADRIARKLFGMRIENKKGDAYGKSEVKHAVVLALHMTCKDMTFIYESLHGDEAVSVCKASRGGQIAVRSGWDEFCRSLQETLHTQGAKAFSYVKNNFIATVLTILLFIALPTSFLYATTASNYQLLSTLYLLGAKLGINLTILISVVVLTMIVAKQGKLKLVTDQVFSGVKKFKWPIILMIFFTNFIFTSAAPNPGCLTAEQNVDDAFYQFSWWWLVIAFLLGHALRGKREEEIPTIKRQWINGSCVRDKRRLDLKLNEGRYPAHWAFRSSERDVRGLDGEAAAEKLGCEKGNKVSAGQIGPIVIGLLRMEPTVIHACNQTKFAAAVRACSNKIYPSSVMFLTWSRFFHKFEMSFHDAITSDGGLVVDLDAWLAKYPEIYRKSVYAALERPDLMEAKFYTYESFPKIELQFTTVTADEKDDPSNTVKERQISGPSVDKKIAANAFVYALEGIAHKYISEYCGRKDWPAICKTIDEKAALLVDPIFGFADGSGFDMTQVIPFQERFNEFINYLLKHSDISLDIRITAEDIMKAFKDSTILRVNVDRGEITYKAEGRASGDGWTTFGNTILMISYWKFVFESLKIPSNKYFLLVKGDDVLFAVEREYVQLIKDNIMHYMHDKNEHVEHGLGQIVKFIKWGNLEDGDFLSNMFFLRRDGTCRMVRIPARVFQTMPWSTNLLPEMRNHEKIAEELTFSKGSCLLAWSRGLPIFETYARKLMELGKPGSQKEYNPYADADRVWNATDDDYEACSEWLGYRFGLNKQDIARIEAKINSITNILETVTIPELDLFYTEL